MEIGKRLKDLRLEKGLSIRQLSKIIKISFQTISKWENNQVRPEYENLVQLARYFAVTTDYLLGLED